MFKLQSRLYLRFECYLYESITNKTQVQYHHLYDDKKAFFSIYGNIEKIKPYRSLKLLYFQISQMFPSWPRKCNKMSLQKNDWPLLPSNIRQLLGPGYHLRHGTI